MDFTSPRKREDQPPSFRLKRVRWSWSRYRLYVEETLKHIKLKPNEDPQDIQETYDSIVAYCDQMHQEYNQMKVEIMLSEDKLARLADKVQIVDAYVSDPESRHVSMMLHYKIDNKKYYRLLGNYRS